MFSVSHVFDLDFGLAGKDVSKIFILCSVGRKHRVKYIFYLETIRPIRTAENFEAVEWATGFANKHGAHCGIA